jgi:hypothetical protein
MNALVVLPYYAKWHYGQGIKDFFHNWKVFLLFLADFFSLGLLAKTLFAPWERMNEGYGSGFNPSRFFETLLVNIIMRLFGFVVRFTVLIFGFLSIVLTMLVGLLFFIVWVCAPVILVYLVAVSMYSFFT